MTVSDSLGIKNRSYGRSEFVGEQKRLRVLIVYGELLEYRIPIFEKLGEKVDLTVTHSGKQMTNNDFGFKEVVLPLTKFWRFKYQFGLREIVRNGRFDTVVFFMDISWLSTVLNFLVPPSSIRRVTWGLWRTGKQLPDVIRIWLSKAADSNIFYSTEAAQDFFACGLSQNRISVARNTVRVDNPGRNNDSVRDSILIVGSFDPRKRNDVTISAFSNTAARINVPVRLVFVGAGEQLEEIKLLASNSPLRDQIEFFPQTHDVGTLRNFYDRAICVVSYGQAGLSVLQSFAFGVPFITSENAISGGEIENIQHKSNGFLVRDTQEHLEEIIEELLSNPAMADSMGVAALNYYISHASASHMVSGFMNAICDELR